VQVQAEYKGFYWGKAVGSKVTSTRAVRTRAVKTRIRGQSKSKYKRPTYGDVICCLTQNVASVLLLPKEGQYLVINTCYKSNNNNNNKIDI
jgi:hypothetical protein